MPPKRKGKKKATTASPEKIQSISPGPSLHDVLSVEVVSLILERRFEGMEEDGSDKGRDYHLQTVSQKLGSAMRQVALATPSIWAAANVNFGETRRFHKLFFDRAKTCPMDMRLTVVVGRTGDYNRDANQEARLAAWFHEFLVSPAAQFRSLKINADSSYAVLLSKWLLQKTVLPHLESLEFADMRSAAPEQSYARTFDRRDLPYPHNTPLLRALTLDRLAFSPSASHWSALRCLTIRFTLSYENEETIVGPIRGYPAERVYLMLSQAQGLEVLHFEAQGQLLAEMLFEESDWTDIATLPKLHTLHLLYVDAAFVEHLLNHLDAPALESVTITKPTVCTLFEQEQVPIVASTSFLNVQTLSLGEMKYNKEGAGKDYHLALCAWFPAVTTLAIPVTHYRRLEDWTGESHWIHLGHMKLVQGRGDEHYEEEKDAKGKKILSMLDDGTVDETVTAFLRVRRDKPGIQALQSLQVYSISSKAYRAMDELGEPAEE